MNSVQILYENDEIFLINKPSGLPVQGGENISHSLDKDFSLQVGYKIYLVHRLDKDTSGLMVVAKNPVAANKWTKLIGSKKVNKEYVAICFGKITPSKGVIKDDLTQHGQNKTAQTRYNVENEWLYETEQCKLQFSKIRLFLDTGRMHQIRIHLAKQGCPLAGDDQHGNFKLNKIAKKELKIKKFLLCSQKITIPVIENNREVLKTFEINLPDYMQIPQNL